jgi:hypothetical protein
VFAHAPAAEAYYGQRQLAHDLRKRGDRVIFTLRDPVEISQGDRLVLSA